MQTDLSDFSFGGATPFGAGTTFESYTASGRNPEPSEYRSPTLTNSVI
jgi:hypothetical protein